jgi:hypothetical protein
MEEFTTVNDQIVQKSRKLGTLDCAFYSDIENPRRPRPRRKRRHLHHHHLHPIIRPQKADTLPKAPEIQPTQPILRF